MEQRIEINNMCEETGISKTFMARQVAMSKQQFNYNINNDKLTEEQLKIIHKACNYPDTGRGKTLKHVTKLNFHNQFTCLYCGYMNTATDYALAALKKGDKIIVTCKGVTCTENYNIALNDR